MDQPHAAPFDSAEIIPIQNRLDAGLDVGRFVSRRLLSTVISLETRLADERQKVILLQAQLDARGPEPIHPTHHDLAREIRAGRLPVPPSPVNA